MYEHLGANDAERKTDLSICKAWVGSRNVNHWNDTTKEELNTIKATY